MEFELIKCGDISVGLLIRRIYGTCFFSDVAHKCTLKSLLNPITLRYCTIIDFSEVDIRINQPESDIHQL